MKQSEFLKHTLSEIERRELKVRMSFFVSEWDFENECGTVCCMQGWLPAIFPEDFKWRIADGDAYVLHTNGERVTTPHGINIGLWKYLTGIGSSYNENQQTFGRLSLSSTFEWVKKCWEKVIIDLEKKNL